MERKSIPRSEWAKLIKAQRESGLSQHKWCKQNGIVGSTFSGWVTKLKAEKNPIFNSTWAKVEPSTSSVMKNEVRGFDDIRLVVNDISVIVPNDFCEKQLYKIMKVLKKDVHPE